MNSLRVAIAVVVLALLSVGYFASQRAYFDGSAPVYAKAVDQPPVQLAALVVLLLVIGSAFLPAKPDQDDPQ